MSAIDMAATMSALAATMENAGVAKRVYDWPPDQISPPCVVVGYPTTLDFDSAFRRASDRAVFPIYVIVGKASERTARNALSNFLTGATGVKDALDGDLDGAVQSARVTDCQVQEVAVGDVPYLAARFDVEVYS